MAIPDSVNKLIERFERNIDDYRSVNYNEARLRKEFLDPFFKALGWDVDNTEGNAEAYKDVIHEDSLRVEDTAKAPDYCFRIGGQRKFFVEAKKPAVNIHDDTSPAYQLRRYAWSAKLPLSILTDFEEFAVYDTRIKPDKNDKASRARVKFIKFSEYSDRWDEIAEIFARDSILKGYFDKFSESTKKKRGTALVDDAFLEEIESWREMIAKNIALRNHGLSSRELNFAVQSTIDRIIFLRICEGRGIEKYGTLMSLQNGVNVYPRLMELFRNADLRYNSGLFHFKVERGRSEPDAITPKLKIDDRVLKDIIKRLYYPESPYEFAMIPPDILGHVYERFLGKVIHLTPGGRAKVEDKPEVRKAGGVYYTPTYIVDYIVKNTVGKLLEGRKIGSRKKLRILDPACGSGSFLIGAYQFLLDWYLESYIKNNPEKHSKKRKPPVFRDSHGDWRLTLSERKRILTEHIFGVDIDPQAVEVTRLSLWLKVLEGENEELLASQLRFLHERALPDLDQNIKCGNSLIGPDFYDNAQMTIMDEDEQYRINVFDWNSEFPDVFTGKNPGFDAVIGNPPYGFHQIHSESIKPYFKQNFVSSSGGFEHYFLFYDRSLRLLNNSGYHGYIVPVTWLTIPSALALRKFILGNYHLVKIAWLPELVFKNAQVNTLISIIQNSINDKVEVEIYKELGFINSPTEKRTYDQKVFINANYYIAIFEEGFETVLLEKIISNSEQLGKFARPCSGFNPYEVGKGEKPAGGPHTLATIKEKPYHSETKLGDDWKPAIIGRDLGRYNLNITGIRWVKYGHWLAAPRDPENYQGNRILVQEIVGGSDRRIIAAYYDQELYYSRDVIPIKIEKDILNAFYLLGLINSRLLSWFHHKRDPKAKKQLFPKVLVSDLRNLPIRPIDFSDPNDRKRHDRMVSLVDTMLNLHKKLQSSKTPHEIETLQRRIAATDNQIDRLVYELYDLTEEEIKIVEG